MPRGPRRINLNDQLDELVEPERVPEPAPDLPRRLCTIALDFDRTFTADRSLWRAFIAGAVKVGHRVICVTARKDSATNRKLLERSFGKRAHERLTVVLFCNHTPKRHYASLRGFRVDIWIDDLPDAICAASNADVMMIERTHPTSEQFPIE